MTDVEPNNPDVDDLIEQHRELRPTFISSDRVAPLMRSRLSNRPGAYEWWQFEAFNAEGTGFRIGVYNGDPFHPVYRRAVSRHLAGGSVDATDLRGTAYTALRASFFEKRRLTARSIHLGGRGSFKEEIGRRTWAISLGPAGVAVRQTETGWEIRLAGTTVRRIGFSGLRSPGSIEQSSLEGLIRLAPRFDTMTMMRAAMPDSPDGSTHDWLPACPCAEAEGQVVVSMHNGADRIIDMSGALGAVHHFWGTGLVGNGMRRWSRATFVWDDGAVHCELPVIRKYIQLAGTLMHFAPDALPNIVRCDHQRTKTFQRSAWLLAHPVEARWTNESKQIQCVHRINQLDDALPFRGFALSQAVFQVGEPPDSTIVGPAIGWFELLQPARADWRIWRRVLTQ